MKLIRSYTDMGTFGKLYNDNDEFLCYTVEQVWRNNEPFISCIPEGVYFLKEYDSPKYGLTVAMHNPENHVYMLEQDRQLATDRYACLFHPANTANQLEGCIAVGNQLGYVNDKWAVLNSKKTFDKVKEYFKLEKTLAITHNAGAY